MSSPQSEPIRLRVTHMLKLLKNLLPLKHLESMAHVERGGIAYSPAYSPKNTATVRLLLLQQNELNMS